MLAPPAARLLHRVQALQEAVRGDAQPVDGAGVGADEVAAAQLDGVDGQRFGDAVELHLEGEAGLDRPVPALRSAGGLVGVGARGVEAVGRHPVRRREQLAGVVGGDQTEGCIGPAVQDDLGVDRGQEAFARGAGAVAHVEGVAAAVGVEDLLPRVEDLDGATRHLREPGDAELQVEGLGLAAEGAADRGLDDANPGRVDLQDAGQLAVEVVGDLRRRPHGEPAVPLGQPDGAVGLDRGVGGALEEVVALDDDLRVLQPGVHIAELELHHLGDVPVPPRLARLVDVRPRFGGDRLVWVEVGRQLLVGDVDEVERGDRRVLVHRGHRRHPVADVAHPVDAEGILVRRPRDDAVGRGHVAPGHHRVDARGGLGPRRVDGDDARVRVRAAQDLGVQHAGEPDVVGVAGPAGRLRQPVHLPHGAADVGEGGGASLVAPHQSPSLAAAASTAS